MSKAGVTLSDVAYTRPRQVSCVIYNNVPATDLPDALTLIAATAFANKKRPR